MGWQDAPAVESAGWQGAPAVSAKEQIDNDAISRAARAFPSQGSDANSGASQLALNILAGAVRGAGSIGATLMWPIDKATDMIQGDRQPGLTSLVTGQKPLSRNEERRARLDENAASFGAQTDSLAYQGGKLGAEVAGTAGVGNVIAAPLRAVSALSARAGLGAIPAADTAATALASGGFRTGATLSPVANVATRVGAGAVTGGASAGLVDPENAPAGAIIGAAAPLTVNALGAVTNKVTKGIREIMGAASPEVRDLAMQAEQLGIKIPADRLVDSPTLNAMAASLKYVPMSGRTATEDAMSQQMNQALSRTIGQDTPNMAKAVTAGRAQLGAKFDDFLQKNAVNMDQPFVNDLAEAATKANQELGPEGAAIINKQIELLLDKGAGGAIEGQAAYNIKKTLDRIGNRNSNEAWYALDLKRKLMDALGRSVGPDQAQEFGQLRQQYGNLLDLEKLVPNGADAEISAARLANMRNIGNPDLQQIADIAAQFLKPRESAHGAAQRVFAGTAAAGAYLGGPLGAIVAPATEMAIGRMANKALNSDAARNAILNPVTQAAEPAMGSIGSAIQKALPITGATAAGALGLGATAPAMAQPAPQATPAPLPQKTSAVPSESPIASIGAAQTADDAIAAAGAALDAPHHAPTITAPPVVAAAVQPSAQQDAAPVAGLMQQQPSAAQVAAPEAVAIWTGRRGDGYKEIGDALNALPTRQKVQPDLDWKIEQMRSGAYRLAGYQRDGEGLMAADGVTAKPTSTGTVQLSGDDGAVRKFLQDRGITTFVKAPGGYLVGRSQANLATG